MSLDPTLALALRLSLALLLLASAWEKLRDRTGFLQALAGYRLLPLRALGPASWAVPGVELGLGAGLVLAAATTAPAAGALFALYAAAIGWNLAQGRRHIDCGCGGPGGRRPIHPALVARNLALVGAAALAALPTTDRALAALDLFTLAAGCGTLALLWAGADVALANRARQGEIGAPA